MNTDHSIMTDPPQSRRNSILQAHPGRRPNRCLVVAGCILFAMTTLAAETPAGRVVSWGLTSHYPDVRPDTVFTNVVCGQNYAVGISSEGRAVRWGGAYSSSPPADLTNVVAVAAGGWTFALRSTGTVVGWGPPIWGDNGAVTNVPAGLSGVRAIAAGDYHALALRSNGTVAVWGGNEYGQTNMPLGLTDVVAIAAGSAHSVALKADGSVMVWGAAWATNMPPGLSDVVRITAGEGNSMALRSNGSIVLWGGGNELLQSVQPDLGEVVAMGCGERAAVVVRKNGTVAVWGVGIPTNQNTFGDRGLTNIPPNLSDVVDVSVGRECAIARKHDGTFVGWGWNFAFEASVPPLLGDVVSLGTSLGRQQFFIDKVGRLVGSDFATQPVGLSNVVALARGSGGSAGGQAHTLALRKDGTVVAWGDNLAGQINVPTGLSNVVAVTAGAVHSVALKADGTVVAWGSNSGGQTNVPAGLSGVKAISAGYQFTIALRSNGTMTAWGQVPSGQPALNNVVAVSGGNGFALALKSDGRVAHWAPDNSIAPPAGLSNVVAVSAGTFHGAALKRDGKVVTWGRPGVVAPLTLAISPNLKNVIAVSAVDQGTYALVLDPALSTVRRDGSSVVLGFRSFFGQSYQIQYSTNLSAGSWLNLPGGNATGTGELMEVTDSNVLSGQSARFYRLVELD